MIWAVTFNPSRDMTYLVDQEWSPGSTVTASEVIARPGGKGNNVARVVKTLGGRVTAVGFYGGHVGQALLAELEASGISSLTEEALGETRTCLSIIAGHGVVTEIRDPGPRVQQVSADRLLEALCLQVGSGDWVTLSGSLPRGLDASLWHDWVERLRPRVRGVLVDAGGANLRAAVSARPSLIVPNRSEWVESGIDGFRPLVMTDGADGIYWYPAQADRVHHLRPPRVKVRNTVGAGDAFLGGLVFALSEGKPWIEVLRFAVAVAAASVTTPGVADLNPRVVFELLPKVTMA